jgi:hypothetical protein
LQKFFGHVLFAGNTGIDASNLGTLLASVETRASAKPAEKDWFRSIVGAELRGLDAGTRRSLIQDPDYGKLFVDALVSAETKGSEQWQHINKALTTGEMPTGSIYVRDIVIDDFPLGAGKKPRDLTVKKVGETTVFECKTGVGTIFLTGNSDTVPAVFSEKSLEGLIKDKKTKVFMSFPGTSGLVEVKGMK